MSNSNITLANILMFLSKLCYWISICLCILVVVLIFPVSQLRPVLLEITGFVQALLPTSIRGVLVFNTYFGGAIRGDFLLFCFLLNLLSRLFEKIAFDYLYE